MDDRLDGLARDSNRFDFEKYAYTLLMAREKERERELLNKLEVELARSMCFRGISDFYSSADLSMPFEEVIVGWARRGEEKEGDVGGSVEFNVGSEMEQRRLRGLRCSMAELLRFDHLYLVASISIEGTKRRRLVNYTGFVVQSSVILLVYGKFEFIFFFSSFYTIFAME